MCKYKNTYFPLYDDSLYIEASMLEVLGNNPYVNIRLDGELFTGVAYELEESVKVNEILCIDGMQADCVVWYRSGAIATADVGYATTIFQTYGWFENGKISSLRIKRKYDNNSLIRLRLKQPAVIENLYLSDEYFSFAKKGKNKLFHSWFTTANDFSKLSLADSTSLIGPGIDDKLLRMLKRQNNLSNLQSLSITSTKLSDIAIETLTEVSSLKEIFIFSEETLPNGDYSRLSTAQAIKRCRPDCSVVLNSQRIEVA